ncbi:MAG: Hpt domain-containing protein [Cellvibrionaceae bacterium]
MTEHVSMTTLTMLKDVMEDGFNELINMYVSDSQARIEALHTAYSAQDCDSVRREAHSLKGSSGNIGAGIMAELTKQVEQKGRDENLEGVEDLISQIEAEYKALTVTLTGML